MRRDIELGREAVRGAEPRAGEERAVQAEGALGVPVLAEELHVRPDDDAIVEADPDLCG